MSGLVVVLYVHGANSLLPSDAKYGRKRPIAGLAFPPRIDGIEHVNSRLTLTLVISDISFVCCGHCTKVLTPYRHCGCELEQFLVATFTARCQLFADLSLQSNKREKAYIFLLVLQASIQSISLLSLGFQNRTVGRVLLEVVAQHAGAENSV